MLQVGDRVVVRGWAHLVTTIAAIEWVPTEARWKLTLDWGEHGTSVVYDTDINNTWYRYSTSN